MISVLFAYTVVRCKQTKRVGLDALQKRLYLNSLMDCQDQLNESKFLSQQINDQEQPTQEQIIEKAEELEIQDLALAKESLTKELDPQWKPYLNRNGEVYYINLQERKAYLDHPVQMEIKITNALKHKKRMPIFKEYAIEKVSRSPRLIQEQISEYERSKGLNIVYEESEEESMRRDTHQSAEEHQGYELDGNQLEAFRVEMERQARNELDKYKREREQEYEERVERSKESVEQAKQEHLNKAIAAISKEIQDKNQQIFRKTQETTANELTAKQYQLEDLQTKEIDLITKLQTSREDKEQQIRTFYRKKKILTKQTQMRRIEDQATRQLYAKLAKTRMAGVESYEKEALQAIYNRVNLKERFEENIERLKAEPRQIKKRFSIFNSEVFLPDRKEDRNSFQQTSDRLNLNDYLYTTPLLYHFSIPSHTPSLALRLSKKIL